MAKPKPIEIGFAEKLARIKQAGLGKKSVKDTDEDEQIESIETRIEKIFKLVNDKKSTHMLYFIMYDIENNKIRNYIAKYLEKKGCIRIQKSIFLTQSERPVFREIRDILKEVQKAYDNQDSILLVPISTDELRSMSMIGKDVDLDFIQNKKSTMFF